MALQEKLAARRAAHNAAAQRLQTSLEVLQKVVPLSLGSDSPFRSYLMLWTLPFHAPRNQHQHYLPTIAIGIFDTKVNQDPR